jgi:SAM-dependent methyltransferase
VKKLLKFGFYCAYFPISRIFLALERLISWQEVRLWVDHAPAGLFKGISFDNYTWWIFQQGFISGILSCYVKGRSLKIFDFGCGMGKLAPVCQFWVQDNGKYLGVDTHIPSIEQCRATYRDLKNCEFYITQDQNAYYKNPGASGQQTDGVDWPVANGSQDVLIASSVFTHLQEADSRKYMKKIHEILAPGGIAIITFHVMRDYVNPNKTFNFTHKLTPGWYTSYPDCPEIAIGVPFSTVQELIAGRFEILNWLEGHSTGGSSPSFQDLFIFKKI